MGTLTSYVGALDAAKSVTSGSAGFSWINIKVQYPWPCMRIPHLIPIRFFLVAYLISRGNVNFASHATDATRRDKAWDRAGSLPLVMRIRTILVAVLISPYFNQKVD